MIGRCFSIMGVVFLTANVLSADEQPQPAEASNSAVVASDIIYFHSEYPIFIRVRIEVDGTSFEHFWTASVQSIFGALDENRDDHLQPEEFILPANAPFETFSREATRLARDPDLWTADRSPLDQTITIEELKAFLVATNRGPFQTAEAASAPGTRGTVGAALSRLLDSNGDQGLSAEEMSTAIASLHRRDLDDDGTLAVSELADTMNPYGVNVASAPTARDLPFVSFNTGSVSLHIIRELERRYAADPPVKAGNHSTLSRDLSCEDLGLEVEEFKLYDFDADGILNRDELRELVRRPPTTLELVIRLGKRSEGELVVERIGSAGEPDIAVRRSTDGLAGIVINDVQIEIAEASNGPELAKQTLLAQFAAADSDNNNYVEKAEAERNNVFRGVFDEFDEDHDGRMFKDEMTAVVDDRMKAARNRTRMEISDRGRNLFEILDVDRNRRLGRRELAQAVRRIELWDADKDGVVSESEIPQLYQI